MPSIGDQSFVVLNGQIQNFSETLDDVTRPHVDGVAFRKVGLRSMPFNMTSIADVADAAAADTLYNSYQADVGDVVDVTDQLGESHTNFIILKCVRVAQKESPRIVGGSNSSGVVLRCQWTLQAAGDPTAT